MISLGHACVNAVTVTMMVHLGFFLDERGFSLQEVGWVIATFTAVGSVSLLVSGYMGDRMPIRPTTFAFCALQSLTLLILLLADNVPVALLFSVLMGIGWGGRHTLTVAARGIYFGRKGFASITATSMVPLHVLSLIAPVFAGYMFDFRGELRHTFRHHSAGRFHGLRTLPPDGRTASPILWPHDGGRARRDRKLTHYGQRRY